MGATAVRDDRAAVEQWLDALERWVLGHRHVVAPPLTAVAMWVSSGLAWALTGTPWMPLVGRVELGWWPLIFYALTLAAVLGVFGVNIVHETERVPLVGPDRPGERDDEAKILNTKVGAGAGWGFGVVWCGVQAWYGPSAQTTLVLALFLVPTWVVWFHSRRVRRGVTVFRYLQRWDGDAVGLPGLEAVESSAKAAEDGSWFHWRLRSDPKGRWTAAAIRKAVGRIGARYERDPDEITVEEPRPGSFLLRWVRADPNEKPLTFEPPPEGWSVRKKARVGRWDDDRSPMLVSLYRDEHGGVNSLTLGVLGSGKALALDTPVPTPTGWTTMGQLRDGDKVFDDRGQVCRVVKAHDTRHNRSCFRVTFSDGEQIVADAEHQWLTEDRESRRSARRAQTSRERRTLLPVERHRAMREFAVGRPLATAATVAAVAGLDWSSRLTRNAAAACTVVGTTQWMTTFRRHNGTAVHRRARGRTYRTDELVDQFIALGSRVVKDQRDRRASGPSVRTTEEIAASVSVEGARNHSVVVATALELPDDDGLPVAPYVLGAWLGDGATAAPIITSADPEMRPLIEERGYRTGQDLRRQGDGTESYTIHGLRSQLRELGVVGDKHIPARYLRAGVEQRRELLAGLLDTDGTVSRRGQIQFTSIRERLSQEVRELAVSLGYRAVLRSRPAKLDGIVCGTAHQVSFTTADPVFRLPRKMQAHQERASRHSPTRTGRRFILSVDAVPSVPVRCITVDSPSRLYLVGRSMIPTHNSNLAEITAAYGVAGKDAIVWAGDLKPGAQQWGPWAPALDWLATSAEEVDAMFGAFMVLMRVRGGAGGRIVKPSAKRPAVVLLLDEGALYFNPAVPSGGPEQMAARRVLTSRISLVENVLATSRSFAVAVHVYLQRAIWDNIGGATIRGHLAGGQSVIFRTAKNEDARLAVDMTADEAEVMRTSKISRSRPGTCFVQNADNEEPRRGRVFQFTEAQRDEIVAKYRDQQPELEPSARAALGEVYANRQRTRSGGALSMVQTDGPGPEESEDEPPVMDEPVAARMTEEESLAVAWRACAADVMGGATAGEVAERAGRSPEWARARLRHLASLGVIRAGKGKRWLSLGTEQQLRERLAEDR